jgi:arylsulfatase A-like enzyme
VIRAYCRFAPLVAVGATLGLALAGREVLRQNYLTEGLWRTSLWVTSRGAFVGSLGALTAGVAVLLLPKAWSALLAMESRPAASPAEARREAARSGVIPQLPIALLSLTGLALFLIPPNPGRKFGLNYPDLVVGLLAIAWIAGTGLAASILLRLSERERPAALLRLRWLACLSFAFIIAFLWTWAKAQSVQTLSALTCLAAAVGVGLYVTALPLFGLVHDRLLRPLGRFVVGRPGRVLASVALVLVGALWSTSYVTARRARQTATQRGRSVILIGIDTLRADRTSLLVAEEGGRDLTPDLRVQLAARGTVYTHAISQAPWTLPAFASIFTGLYPAEHGAEYRGSMLRASQVTLAELLREAGYRTLGVSSGAYVTRASGLHQGFEVFDESQALGQRSVSSTAVTDTAIRLLRSWGEEPFFLFAHYFDPHWIYQDHADLHFGDSYDGPLRDAAARLNQEEFKQHVGCLTPRRPHFLPPRDRDYLLDLYEEEIAFMDSEIGRLLRYLEEAGLWGTTLVVAVADHGEEFAEHGQLGHQGTLFQELIHVPLVVANPADRGPREVSHPVETRSLFTTVLAFLDLEAPASRTYQVPLGFTAPSVVRSSTHALSIRRFGGMSSEPEDVWLTCAQTERWKIIKNYHVRREFLFDLQGDPEERRSCGREHPEARLQLEADLGKIDRAVLANAPRRRMPEVDEDHKRRLRALGYL